MGRISDAELVAQLHRLNQEERGREAELLLYLGELDSRRFYRMEACSSAFEYCVLRLGYSEDVAWKRVGAARLMRRFPRIFELLSEGRVHLSALMLLKPHLNEQNQQELLLASCSKTKRQVEQLIAARYPKPDIAASIRKQPDSKASNESSNSEVELTLQNLAARKASLESTRLNAGAREASLESSAGIDANSRNAPLTSTSISTSTPVPGPPATPPSASSPAQHLAPSRPTVSVPPLSAQSRMVPLSTNTYRITFTASDQLKRKLERASELLSHRVRPGDLPTLIERAIDQLLEREEKRRFGAQPGRKVAAPPSNESDTQSSIRAIAPSNGTDVPAANDIRGIPALAPSSTTMHMPRQERSTLVNVSQDPDPHCPGVDEVPLGSAVNFSKPLGELQRDDAKSQQRKHVPVALRRAVFERDAGQCTFVDNQGRRCAERRSLEFDHIVAHAIGGKASIDNLRLRCRAHNRLAAEQLFGPVHVTSAIRHAALLRR